MLRSRVAFATVDDNIHGTVVAITGTWVFFYTFFQKARA